MGPGRGRRALLVTGAPCTITVELNTADQADPYRNRGDVVVTGPRTIEATAGTWWEAWRAIYLTR